MVQKDELRNHFLSKRKQIPLERREQASQLSFTLLQQWLQDFSPHKHTPILSFAPFKDEIDIWPLNRWILKERTLLLPRLHENDLHIYRVGSLQDLKPSPWGILEPDFSREALVDPATIAVALVAGLAFDNNMHRLGYGKGYYDKFLLQLKPYTPKIGVGFKEQLSLEPLPIQPHDVLLTHRFLF
jgi:5-formyltetrahydrofolate cyclo-ligase